MGRLHLAALNHGVFFSPRGYMELSTAFDNDVIDDAGDRLGHAIQGAALELGIADRLA